MGKVIGIVYLNLCFSLVNISLGIREGTGNNLENHPTPPLGFLVHSRKGDWIITYGLGLFKVDHSKGWGGTVRLTMRRDLRGWQ